MWICTDMNFIIVHLLLVSDLLAGEGRKRVMGFALNQSHYLDTELSLSGFTVHYLIVLRIFLDVAGANCSVKHRTHGGGGGVRELKESRAIKITSSYSRFKILSSSNTASSSSFSPSHTSLKYGCLNSPVEEERRRGMEHVCTRADTC